MQLKYSYYYFKEAIPLETCQRIIDLGVSKIEVENRILDFIFSDFWITFQKTKNKFYLSKKMKEFSKLATNKIKQQIH